MVERLTSVKQTLQYRNDVQVRFSGLPAGEACQNKLFFIHELAKRVWPSGLLQPIMNNLNFQLFKLFPGVMIK